MESNTELLARYARVKSDHDRAIKQKDRAKLGSNARRRKAMWAGCLEFTRLDILAEMEARGISAPASPEIKE